MSAAAVRLELLSVLIMCRMMITHRNAGQLRDVSRSQ